jgi:hypothetical protein
MTSQSLDFTGVGIYFKGDEPGTLRAEWARSDRIDVVRGHGVVCGGLATGGPGSGFAGTYTIIYTGETGEPSPPIELDDKLVLGWRPQF